MALPLSFEANRGQFDSRVRFVSRSGGATVFLTDDSAVMALPGRPLGDVAAALAARQPVRRGPGAAMRMRIVGAGKSVPVGLRRLPGTANYFVGSDARRWRTHVPTYQQVRFAGVYAGIDLVYYGNPQRLEYDFVLRPGADPAQIRLAFSGAERLRVAGSGDLVATTSVGDVCWKRPFAYQLDGARRVQVACDYSVAPGSRRVSFRLARYDASRPLVVDPTLAYSTYVGGRGQDRAMGVATDASGAAYLVGYTSSPNFPVSMGGYQRVVSPGFHATVTKISRDGGTVLYSTYLGGEGTDQGRGIAVDSTGAATVVGYTGSSMFPVSRGAFQAVAGGTGDGFVAKLSPDGGTLVYSTYLGGSGADAAYGVALDAAGAPVVTGCTSSAGFPTTPGAYQPALCKLQDAFVTRLSGDGTALQSSTLLGGSNDDTAYQVAIDPAGAACIVGSTLSADLPATTGAFQTRYGGLQDAFAARISADGMRLVYSTYLGGSGSETGYGIAIDAAGAAYLCGVTTSANFPITAGAAQIAYKGAGDAFVTKLAAAGGTPGYSTFLGGASGDAAVGVAVTATGSAVIAGFTSSTNYPTTSDAYKAVYLGNYDCILTKLNATGSGMNYSTYIGGTSGDFGNAVALAPGGAAVIAAESASINFPTSATAIQRTNGGGTDALALQFVLAQTAAVSVGSAAGQPGQTVTLGATLSGGGAPLAGRTMTFTVGAETVGTVTTDAAGAASVTLRVEDRFGIGAIPVRASFAGDGSYEGDTGTGTLTTSPASTAIAVADRSAASGGTVVLTAALQRSSDSAVLVGRAVVFKVGTKTVGTATTKANGVASLLFRTFNTGGQYRITAAFAGETAYRSSVGAGMLTVSSVGGRPSNGLNGTP